MARRRRRRQQDTFGKRARREGYPARSVYKLEEIDRRVRLLKRGQRVLDLGAAPGSWLLYAADVVGPQGRVVGVDLQEIRVALPAHAELHQRDVREVDASELGTFDVVLSDMAPSTTGQKDVDQARSHELFMTALEVASRVLAPKGRFCAKIFQGPDLKLAEAAVAERFEQARIVRPKATRTESYELFIVGLGFRGRTPG